MAVLSAGAALVAAGLAVVLLREASYLQDVERSITLLNGLAAEEAAGGDGAARDGAAKGGPDARRLRAEVALRLAGVPGPDRGRWPRF